MALRRRTKGRGPGLDTTEFSAVQEDHDAPPSADAQSAGAYPRVIAGSASTIVGVLMVIGAVLIVVDAAGLRSTSDPLGPGAFPMGVGILLGLCGVAMIVANHRFVRVLLRAKRSPLNGRGRYALAILLLLVAFGIVLPFAGFFLSAAALFVAAALVLGSPRRWQIGLGAVILSGVIVLLFDRVIGLTLPAGPWGF